MTKMRRVVMMRARTTRITVRRVRMRRRILGRLVVVDDE